MKNWPDRAKPWKDKLQLKVSDWVLKKAEAFEKRDGGFISHLQQIAEHRKKWKNDLNKDISPKAETYPNLNKIVFYDIYSVEEFKELDKGLNRILDKYPPPDGSFARIMEARRDHSPWLNKARKTTFSAGMAPAGMLYFGDTDSVKYLDYANLWLTGITPSFICVTIIAEPNEKLKNEYRRIIEGPTSNDFKLTFPNIKFGFSKFWYWHRIGHSQKNPLDVRQRLLDELFLKVNKKFVRVMRKNYNAGLLTDGPLPFIEVLSIGKSFSKIPNCRSAREGFSREDRGFLSSIGYNIATTNPYIFRWLRFYTVKRSSHYNIEAHQILISTPDYKESSDFNADKDISSNIHRELYYKAPNLCPMLSVSNLFRKLQRDIIKNRNNLVPSFNKSTNSGLGIRGLKRNIKNLASLNRLRFQQERLWSELQKDKQIKYLTRDLRGARRYPYGEGNRIDFVDDWQNHIKQLKNSNERQIEVLQPAYEELLSLKNILVGCVN